MSHHSSNLIVALQELNNLRLVGGLNTGKAACPTDSLALLSTGQVIKLTASVSLASHILILSKDANTTADSNSGALVVT